MTATSNANTSGLEVVAWRWREKGTPMDWRFEGDAPTHQDLRWNEAEPLVTAASAQARIAELRNAYCAAESDAMTLRKRATAAEARADRLANIVKLLDECIWFNPDTQNFEINHDGSVEKARAAIQQETQK